MAVRTNAEAGGASSAFEEDQSPLPLQTLISISGGTITILNASPYTNTEIGVPSDVSCANFILARFKSQEEAEACDEYLKTQGLIVRRVAGYQLPT